MNVEVSSERKRKHTSVTTCNLPCETTVFFFYRFPFRPSQKKKTNNLSLFSKAADNTNNRNEQNTLRCLLALTFSALAERRRDEEKVFFFFVPKALTASNTHKKVGRQYAANAFGKRPRGKKGEMRSEKK